MKKPYRMLVYDIFETLSRIEEVCTFTSFYFSKIYKDIDFKNISKYARISKLLVFLAIQRSKSMASEILREIDILEQNGIMVDEKLKSPVIEILEMVKSVEKEYRQENYGNMIKQLNYIGKKCKPIKDSFERFELNRKVISNEDRKKIYFAN